jgi:hypothetical protein
MCYNRTFVQGRPDADGRELYGLDADAIQRGCEGMATHQRKLGGLSPWLLVHVSAGLAQIALIVLDGELATVSETWQLPAREALRPSYADVQAKPHTT